MVSEAYTEGQRAGRLSLPASLNPYEFGTSSRADWDRGRLASLPRSAICRYRPLVECNCGGRGMCLDVA